VYGCSVSREFRPGSPVVINVVSAASGADRFSQQFVLRYDVDCCIFSENTRELYMTSVSATRGFRVTNCVFSGSLPPGDIYLATSGNAETSETALFSYVYFATALCPNSLPAPTPPKSPEPTVPQTPAVTTTRSPQETQPITAPQTGEATPLGSPAHGTDSFTRDVRRPRSLGLVVRTLTFSLVLRSI
jgi:hypothetical protein